MAHRFNKPCKHPMCPNVTTNKSGYCDRCMASGKAPERSDAEYDRRRGSAHQRGYDARWRNERADFLQENPLCVFCKRRGLYVSATVVDHIKPHKGDMKLFWDRSNWQPLCKPCHDSEKQRQERR